jgi:zinc/manganese transport system permease protein
MFPLLQYDFVQNAFLAGSLIAIMTAIIGYFVVLRAQAFAGEAFADIGFAGATGAAILGIGALLGMLGLSLFTALGIGALGERVRGRDIEIGMVLSFALGLGVLFLSIYIQNGANANAGVSVLFGSILTVTRRDVIITLITGSVTLLLLVFLFRPLLFASVDPEVAQARGVPVRLLSIVFLLLLAVATAEAVLMIGVLLVFALLIAPAAAAEHLTHRPLTAIILSIILGLAFTWGGLILAFVGIGRHLPVSFYISTMAALTYFASLVIARFRSPRRYRELPHPNREHISVHTHPLTR